MFLKALIKNINFNLKKRLEKLEILFYMVILWPLRTLWRNLHIFKDILKFSIENKKIFRENCFENVVSEIHIKVLVFPYKPTKIMKVFMILVFSCF